MLARVMCFVIAVGLDPSAVAPLESELETPLPAAPSHIAERFDGHQEVRMLYGGGCCCGFFREPLNDAGEQRLRRKYAKRGWNEARIDRVVRDQRRVGGLDSRAVESIAKAANAAGSLSVAVYWDLGEETELAKGESLKIAEFRTRRPSLASGRIVRLSQ